jgi:DNA segregation ATPase FtsK/SpoIIIE-like protein
MTNALAELIAEIDIESRQALVLLRAKERLTGCTSYLQRKLCIKYNRARLLLLILEQAGLISQEDGPGRERTMPDPAGVKPPQDR